MSLLHAGVDSAVIALWLGHADTRSTDAYLHADPTIKQRALERTTPISSKPGRDEPPFVWHKPADEIIEKVRRGRSALHQIKTATHH